MKRTLFEEVVHHSASPKIPDNLRHKFGRAVIRLRDKGKFEMADQVDFEFWVRTGLPTAVRIRSSSNDNLVDVLNWLRDIEDGSERDTIKKWIDTERKRRETRQILTIEDTAKSHLRQAHDAKVGELRQEERLDEATTKANRDAYNMASAYVSRGKAIPFGTIVETVMKKHFESCINRETDKVTGPHRKELTREWKNKRRSIRLELMRKFPRKKATAKPH